jgi:hypothetical protein
MKHLISSVTIGACLLLCSAGAVFTANPQNPHGGPAKGMGQLGTGGTGAASCGATVLSTGATQGSPPGQFGNLTTNSPFPTSLGGSPNSQPNYSGTGPPIIGGGTGNYGAGTTGTPNTHANSQYDNACLRHQVP